MMMTTEKIRVQVKLSAADDDVAGWLIWSNKRQIFSVKQMQLFLLWYCRFFVATWEIKVMLLRQTDIMLQIAPRCELAKLPNQTKMLLLLWFWKSVDLAAWKHFPRGGRKLFPVARIFDMKNLKNLAVPCLRVGPARSFERIWKQVWIFVLFIASFFETPVAMTGKGKNQSAKKPVMYSALGTTACSNLL